MQGEKILVTGPAGQIAFPLCRALAADNEVWGIARFGDEQSRHRVEEIGVTTRAVDLATGDYGDLPDDFTHVLHLATYQGAGLDYDHALEVNAVGTGLLLQHCRRARAALVMSTASVYEPHPDPWHAYREDDPLGDSHSPYSPTYSVSKIAEEAVARTCARMLQLPVVVARMNSAYGANGGLPAYQLDWMAGGKEVTVRWDPCPYSVIHEDDIAGQVEPLLAAASVPATIVNWGGDEAVSPHEWCAYMGELLGVTPRMVVKEMPGTQRGASFDVTKRLSITGPCRVSWKDGFRRMVQARYPDGIPAGGMVDGQASKLLSAYEQPSSGDA